MNIPNYFIWLAGARSFISGIGLTRLYVAGISLCLWLVGMAVSRLMGGLMALVMVATMTITFRLRAGALAGVAVVCLLLQALLAAVGLNAHGGHAITVQLAMVTFWSMVVSVALYARTHIREGRTELTVTRAEVAWAAAEEHALASRLAPRLNGPLGVPPVAAEVPSAYWAAASAGGAIAAPQAHLERLTEKQQQRLRAHTSYLARLGADHGKESSKMRPCRIDRGRISDIVPCSYGLATTTALGNVAKRPRHLTMDVIVLR